MTPIDLQEPAVPAGMDSFPTDDAAVLSEDIAAALGEGTLYLRLDAAAVWLVD